jgi:hypothetical protein
MNDSSATQSRKPNKRGSTLLTLSVSQHPRDLSPEARLAYERAFGFAVLERDVRFTIADAVADWFVRKGRHTYGKDDTPI